MIIAVTGAKGSIGKELIPFLESLGHQVLTISSSAQSDGDKIFSYSDLADKKIPFNKVHLFIHLASINSNLKKEQIKQEVNITKKILFSLSTLNCKNLIFFSTSKVYGDNSFDLNYFNESSSLKPACNYGKAKKLCEELIHSESLRQGLNTLILRMPPVLNQSNSSNVGRLIYLSKKGIPILSLAQGDFNKRSFISFNNIKTVISFIIQNIKILEKNEIYNLSDEDFISLNELLRVAGSIRIYSLPLFFGKLFFNLPILKNILVKLFGNFVLDNSKLKLDMNVKLETTIKSLPIITK